MRLLGKWIKFSWSVKRLISFVENFVLWEASWTLKNTLFQQAALLHSSRDIGMYGHRQNWTIPTKNLQRGRASEWLSHINSMRGFIAPFSKLLNL